MCMAAALYSRINVSLVLVTGLECKVNEIAWSGKRVVGGYCGIAWTHKKITGMEKLIKSKTS